VKHPINVLLLLEQEKYFWYVKQRFMYLETAYRAWNEDRARGGRVGPP
jgi:hypothetical protein